MKRKNVEDMEKLQVVGCNNLMDGRKLEIKSFECKKKRRVLENNYLTQLTVDANFFVIRT